jgi:hypothetical protein
MLRIAQYKLRRGAHDIYDPRTGACLLETAIFVAGFPHRPVLNTKDCPPCFSRVFAAYALRLNERMPDNLRTRLLMPFVTRLADTADTHTVESERATFIATQAQVCLAKRDHCVQNQLASAIKLAPTNPKLSAWCTAEAFSIAAHQRNVRKVWASAAAVLDRAMMIGNSRPAKTMSALIASATSMKPTALAEGTPAELSQPDRKLEFA